MLSALLVAQGAVHTTLRVRIPAEDGSGRRLGDFIDDIKPVPFTELFYPHGLSDPSTGHVLTALAPWAVDVNPDAKVFRSTYTSRAFAALFSRTAPGLDATYLEVFTALERGLCVPYVIGGEVRDMLWHKEGLDVDISFSCSSRQVAKIAERNGWPVLVRHTYVRLGEAGAQDPIEGKEGATTLTTPTAQQEFVCNSLIYDVGINQAVIDRLGQGVEDDKNKVIRIPGDEGDWPLWVEAGPNKLVRYFKLRAQPKAFTGEPRTAAFVLGEIRRRMASDRAGTQELFQHQLSHFLLGLDAEASRQKLGQLRDAMVEDLGADWYQEFVAPVEPQIGDMVI